MALPTLDATFASAADLPRRYMLAKWLVGEKNETAGPSSVLVSGAGTTAINGIYFPDGTDGGKTKYTLTGTTSSPLSPSGFSNSIYWTGTTWQIVSTTGQYTSFDNVTYPWLATSWLASGGSNPVPTVTEIPAANPIANYLTLPERYLWAKIAVAAGGAKDEAAYIGLPKNYAWKDIYDAVSGSSLGTIDWTEKQALGHIAAAYRGDTANPANLATYIDWPWRYQVASIITALAVDADAQSFITASGATDIEGIDQFVKGVKNLGLWSSMVCWPLRSSQNAGTGTTAYSLGGLGTFNGTLVNGPTWTADGLDFDGSNDQVTLPNGAFGTGNAATSIWAFRKNDSVGARMAIISQGNNNSSADSLSLESPNTLNGKAAVNMAFSVSSLIGNNVVTNVWASLFAGHASTNGFSGGNGGVLTQFALANSLNKTGNSCSIGRMGSPLAFPFDGVISAVIRINATPTTTLNGQIHTLYKQTLGLGLGLP